MYPFLPQPNLDIWRGDASRIRRAVATLREVAPAAGSYLSESDYAKPNWQKESWGGNWQELAKIKRRYDPTNLFVVHHGVGDV